MCARFSPQQVSHAVERGCGCVRARESAVKSSIAQSTAACAGPAFGGGPARRQPVPPQGAEALAFTGRRTMNTRGTRPGLSPTFYRWAEPSLTVQPLGTGRPLAISAVYRGPDFPRACSSSPDTDGVLQPRKSMTMLDLLAMEPAKAAPIPERNQSKIYYSTQAGRPTQGRLHHALHRLAGYGHERALNRVPVWRFHQGPGLCDGTLRLDPAGPLLAVL